MRKSDLLWHVPVALALLTRLPLPDLPDRAFDGQARAVWAYPLAGALVGALAGLVGLAALALTLPAGIAAGLVLAAQVVVTGAMHEDGLADTADGIWGGLTRDRRLEIMRDSRIGTYGVLALVLGAGLRWMALAALLPLGIGGIIAAAALSRAMMPALMAALPHARDDGLSRSVGKPPRAAVLSGLALGLAIAIAAVGGTALIAALVAGLLTLALGRIARARIGGQTGDILGAAQQLAEIAILLTLVATAP